VRILFPERADKSFRMLKKSRDRREEAPTISATKTELALLMIRM
jgi:hypothetical protein